MFPYDEIPKSKLRTSLDVESFGRQSLIRALNIGRVISFVGSGTSLKFGQPAWSEFRNRAAKQFFMMENFILSLEIWENGSRFKDEFRRDISPLVCKIKELWGQTNDLDAHYFVELCEDYFFELGKLLEKHKSLTEN